MLDDLETTLLHQTLGLRQVAELRSPIPLGLGTPRDVGIQILGYDFIPGEEFLSGRCGAKSAER